MHDYVHTHTDTQPENQLLKFVCLEDMFFSPLFWWKIARLVKFLKFKPYLNIPYLLVYSVIENIPKWLPSYIEKSNIS